MRREVFESIENRADVSPSEPPSCCFFTLTNSRQSCCSLAFDPWTRHAAAGFADSSIRLFNLQVGLLPPAPPLSACWAGGLYAVAAL
jgi:hypothetical protein